MATPPQFNIDTDLIYKVTVTTPKGEIVWDFMNPVGGDAKAVKGQPSGPPRALFRATRVPQDHPAVARLRADR